MITVRQLAQEVMRLESGGDVSDDSQLLEGYVMLLVRQAANKLIAPLIFSKMAEGDRGPLQMLIVGYEVDVSGQEPNKYLDLPEFYQNLPFNKGLYGIAPIEDPTNHFIPRNNPSVTQNLPCADLEPDQNSYYTEGLRVYFDKSMELAKVLVKLMVVAPDSITPDAALPIYPEMQFDIIALTRQMLRDQPIQDKILDNNPDIGVKTGR